MYLCILVWSSQKPFHSFLLLHATYNVLYTFSWAAFPFPVSVPVTDFDFDSDSSLLIHHGHFGGWLLGTHWHLFNSPHRPIGNYSFLLYSQPFVPHSRPQSRPDRVINNFKYFSALSLCRTSNYATNCQACELFSFQKHIYTKVLTPYLTLPSPTITLWVSAVKCIIKLTFDGRTNQKNDEWVPKRPEKGYEIAVIHNWLNICQCG